jgi:hypothetical protein
MPYTLYELHKLAHEGQIHQAQFAAGMITAEEFKGRVEILRNHVNHQVPEVHAKHAESYRELINGTLSVADVV